MYFGEEKDILKFGSLFSCRYFLEIICIIKGFHKFKMVGFLKRSTVAVSSFVNLFTSGRGLEQLFSGCPPRRE